MSENLYTDGKILRNKNNYDEIRWNCRKCSRKECICDAEVYTSWSKPMKINGEPRYIFNHISEGYSEEETQPKPVDKTQKKLWKGSKWQKKKVFMKDGRILEENE